MNKTLEEIILEKCRRKFTPLEPYNEEEEESVLHDAEEAEEDGEMIEELPLEDILAEKRREYNAKEQFVFLLYNDILMYFVEEWDGKYLRKKPRKSIYDSKDTSDEDEYYYEGNDNENTHEIEERDSNLEAQNEGTVAKSSPVWPWKLTLPDEYAVIRFINNNTYSGRISRKMMEGEGIYRWSSGARYKGEFQRNRMHGRGLLEWNSVCWYEGDFVDGRRHGKGIMVDGDSRYMYTGQWYRGQRHGKGYCRYGDNGSYDGDWVTDKMNGVGLRIYPSGARYVGHWKDGIRDGTGTMVWTNGNVYRGEWKCGAMNGYGEYVWNGFFNKTLAWPREASYVGHWRHGLRHGKGEVKLNTVGGAKYSGCWKENKKHGYGVLIGNNGERFEASPLFLNDILCPVRGGNDASENEREITEEIKCARDIAETNEVFIEKPDELAETTVTPVLKPEQFPCLSYYITRLLNPQDLEPSFTSSISSGKCYECETESCSCLAHTVSFDTIASVQKDFVESSSSKVNAITSTESHSRYEERWVYNCLTLHMRNLRKIYNDYATLYAKSPASCNVTMSRLCLWQLWRDCGIHKTGLGLTEIDNYIAKNEATLVKDPHYPFELIEIQQFLHALLEVSWHTCTKHNDIKVEDMDGKLAGGLHTFLNRHVYPHVGNHVGSVYHDAQDLFPIRCVFELYQRIGYPPSAKHFLRVTCTLKGKTDLQLSPEIVQTVNNFPHGINTVTVGQRVSYLLKPDGMLASSYCTFDVPQKDENDLSKGLRIFEKLGASRMVEIMALVCPGIKDNGTGIITNMDYELTFLEFYEIILEATKQLLRLKKEVAQLARNVVEETAPVKAGGL